MSLFTSHNTLVTRGRKAGLTTRELYSALAGRPLTETDQTGQADCNGYIVSVNQQGQRIYHPGADRLSRTHEAGAQREAGT